MFQRRASRMMRTTLDIDDPVLKEIKVIHEKEGRSMGSVVSQLLAEALVRHSLWLIWRTRSRGSHSRCSTTSVELDTYRVSSYIERPMIRSFKCKETERIWQGQSSRKFPSGIQNRALRKLRQLDAAATVDDLRHP